MHGALVALFVEQLVLYFVDHVVLDVLIRLKTKVLPGSLLHIAALQVRPLFVGEGLMWLGAGADGGMGMQDCRVGELNYCGDNIGGSAGQLGLGLRLGLLFCQSVSVVPIRVIEILLPALDPARQVWPTTLVVGLHILLAVCEVVARAPVVLSVGSAVVEHREGVGRAMRGRTVRVIGSPQHSLPHLRKLLPLFWVRCLPRCNVLGARLGVAFVEVGSQFVEPCSLHRTLLLRLGVEAGGSLIEVVLGRFLKEGLPVMGEEGFRGDVRTLERLQLHSADPCVFLHVLRVEVSGHGRNRNKSRVLDRARLGWINPKLLPIGILQGVGHLVSSDCGSQDGVTIHRLNRLGQPQQGEFRNVDGVSSPVEISPVAIEVVLDLQSAL